MSNKRYFFPVGHEQSEAQLKRFDWQDLQQRSLYDPRFAGCDLLFSWRNYLELKFQNKGLEQEVSKTLDQIAKTPEGQHIIRQAYAMQNYRIRRGETQYARDQEGKLYIGDTTNALTTAFFPRLNMVMIYPPTMTDHSYRGVDGQYHHFSLARGLFHELLHAADGFSASSERTWLSRIKGAELRAQEQAILATAKPGTDPSDDPRAHAWFEKKSSITEYPAMRAANTFMKTYFGEIPQVLQHNESRENGFWNDLLGRTNAQPHLSDGMTYDRIVHLPPPCKDKGNPQLR